MVTKILWDTLLHFRFPRSHVAAADTAKYVKWNYCFSDVTRKTIGIADNDVMYHIMCSFALKG